MRICVIGLGKLGLPVASAFRSQGFDVVGVDNNEALIQSLQDRTFTTDEPNVSLDGIDFKTQVPSNCAAAFICVPTPSKPDGAFDDKYVRDAISHTGSECQLIVVVSTLMPGQSRPLAKWVGMEHCLFCYSPTFIALGSVVRDFLNPDVRIIGSDNKEASESLCRVYRQLPYAPIKQMSLESAEIAKLATNCFVTTKIAYANQLQMLCESTPNADVDDVTEAMGLDSRIGPKYLKAGMPFGGPCFPRDDSALVKEFFNRNLPPEIPKGTQYANLYHFQHLAELVPQGRVLMLGKSYKAGTSVQESSPLDKFGTVDSLDGRYVSSDSADGIESFDVVVICTQDPRWLQGDYRDKIVFDPWGYFKEHGIVCKQLITPGRRR